MVEELHVRHAKLRRGPLRPTVRLLDDKEGDFFLWLAVDAGQLFSSAIRTRWTSFLTLKEDQMVIRAPLY